MNSRITGIGLVTTGVLTAMLFSWTVPFADQRAMGMSFLFGLFLQLGVFACEDRLQNYSKSLLIMLLVAVLGSLLPMSSVLVIIATVLLLGWYLVRCLKGSQWNQWKIILGVVGFGFLYAVIIFESLGRNISTPFIDEEIRQFALNPDTLFHGAMAEMIKNYNHIGTGLDGLVRVHYHILSHFLYGRTAELLDIRIYQVYGAANLIVFAPLLVTGCLRFLFEISNSPKTKFALLNLIVLGGPLAIGFGFQYNSHFVSESYLLGLILLTGAFVSLIRLIRHEQISWPDLALICPYLLLMSPAKISVGFVYAMGVGIALLAKVQIPFWYRVRAGILPAVFWLVGYLLARTVAIPGLEVAFKWKWFQDEVAQQSSTVLFLLSHFQYFFILAPLFAYIISRPIRNREFVTWLVFLLAAFLVGFLALNLTVDSSGYYFSNVHAFIAMVIAGFFLTRFQELGALIIAKGDWSKRYSKALISFFAISSVFFFFSILPKSFQDIREIRQRLRANASYQNQYSDLFKTVYEDQDPNLMVYIPKSEVTFWNNKDDSGSPWKRDDYLCIRIPFLIPLLTGKPAIFGLPDRSHPCYTFFRGYESYSEDAYKASVKSSYTDEELCQAVRQHGFHGYYHVARESGAVKHLCN